jgi:hypothetical protein
MNFKYLDCDFQPCELYTSADSEKCLYVKENFSCDRSCDASDTKRVCANDGITYDNICKLQERSCETLGQVQFRHYGACSPGQPRIGPDAPQAVYPAMYPQAALPSMTGEGLYWNRHGLFLRYK